VRLEDGAGRVAAADVTSPIDVPPFARSAMDGYAVVAATTAGASRSSPSRLRLLDRIYTGQPSAVTVTPGACAEIATGAPLPAGADAVVMVEDTAKHADHDIDIFSPAAAGQNIGRRGADIVAGDRVVAAGDLLSPSRVGALAAIGCTGVEVYARPRVAILSTGNEVIEPGQALAPGQIFDVNRFTLGAIVSTHGGIPETHRAAQDTVEALIASLDACRTADLIVFSGGSSVGERDLVVDAIAARGEMIFHGIAVRPGKPTGFAMVSGTPFFGMPGNPTSCLSNAYILLVPFLRSGRAPSASRTAHRPRAARPPHCLGREPPSVLHGPPARRRRASRLQGSGDITSLSQADGYIEIAADRDTVDEGTIVDVTLF
jgi:molybdenum cofactor synthesis domain-containing protein